MAAAGTVMTFAPFVDWGKFLPNPASNEGQRVKAELRMARLSTLIPFLLIIPRLSFTQSDDAALNQEAFRTWQLIRLPRNSAATRMTLLLLEHLAWYAFTYGACGSIGLRKVGRGANAHVMEACMTPRLARPLRDLRRCKDHLKRIPYLGLEIDSNGDILILPPTWDPNANGIVGYGRYLNV